MAMIESRQRITHASEDGGGVLMEVTLAQELNLRKAGNIARILAITLLFIVTYLQTFVDLHAKYLEVDSYYSHGYLIPLVSAFVVWLKGTKLKSMTVAPSPAGLWALGGGLLLYLGARWWYVNVVANFSMLVVLVGLVLYLFGKAITWELVFPLAFLVFMIPLNKLSIIYITFWLKLLASSAAADIVSAMGIPVLVEGAFLTLPNALLEIDNACSGLRSLIALAALGVAYAYFVPVSFAKKCVLVLTSIPIAMAANLIRIVILILVSYFYSPQGQAYEVADFTTGFLIFLIAFAALFIISKGTIAWEKRQMAASVPG